MSDSVDSAFGEPYSYLNLCEMSHEMTRVMQTGLLADKVLANRAEAVWHFGRRRNAW